MFVERFNRFSVKECVNELVSDATTEVETKVKLTI